MFILAVCGSILLCARYELYKLNRRLLEYNWSSLLENFIMLHQSNYYVKH
jgi:hypothetical protein